MVGHDKNSNGDIDSNWLGIPTEGCGASNGAAGGAGGGPSWGDAKFYVPVSREGLLTGPPPPPPPPLPHSRFLFYP